VCKALKHFTLFLLITGRNAGIQITHWAILRFFAPEGRHIPLIITKLGSRRKQKIPYVICQMSRRLVDHIYLAISSPINFINPEFCKLICLVGAIDANPLIHIHEIYRFYVHMRSTKTF